MRFIIIVIAIGLVWFILKRTLIQLFYKPQQTTSTQESMLACKLCNIHIPASEAITHDNKHFCSQKHLDDWIEKSQ